MKNTEYQKLVKLYEKYQLFGKTSAILHWDMAVNMPESGYKIREQQLGLIHDQSDAIIRDKEVKTLLAAVDEAQLDQWQLANFKQMQRIWQHETAISQKLKQTFLQHGLQCEFVWRKARLANDFKKFAVELEKVVGDVREIAKIKSQKLGLSEYDALLDSYDPGMRSKDIDVIFNDLEEFLPDFVNQAIAQQKPHGLNLEYDFLI